MSRTHVYAKYKREWTPRALFIRQLFGSSFLSYHWSPSPWLLRNLPWTTCHIWIKRLVSIMHFSVLVSLWGPPRAHPWRLENALGTIVGASHMCACGVPQVSMSSRCISHACPWETPPTRWESPRAIARGWLYPPSGSSHRRSPVDDSVQSMGTLTGVRPWKSRFVVLFCLKLFAYV